MNLNPSKFAVAASLTWGLYILMVGWLAAAGWGNHSLITTTSALYLGFKPTFLGGIIGAIWGLVDGCIAGYVFALAFNRLKLNAKKSLKS